MKHYKEHLLVVVQHRVVGSPRRGAKGFCLMLPFGLMIGLHDSPTDSVCSLFVLGKAHLPETCEFAGDPRTILHDQDLGHQVLGQVLQLVMSPRKMTLRRGWDGTVQQAES